MKKTLFCISVLTVLSGCVGMDLPPRAFDWKPFRMLRGSEQIGRDQITNRYLAAKRVLPLKDLASNEVLSLLGQPQQIMVREPNISEDWLYVYYNLQPKERLDSTQSSFIVQIYHDKVMDVVRN